MVNFLRRVLPEAANGRAVSGDEKMERGMRLLWRMRIAILVVDVLALASIWLAAWWVVKAVESEGDRTRRLVVERTK